jgi:chromosome segregation ATPase
VESLLEFAEELERRDAALAEALDGVERLQREVDDLRRDAAAIAQRLATLPGALAQAEVEERATRAEMEGARSAVEEGEAALERARRDTERLAAERDLQRARDELRVADERAAIARLSRERLVGEGEASRQEAERLTSRAAGLGTQVRGVRYAGGGLDGVLEWASRARGELLLEQSSLAGQRETIVREASELLGGVLGEPLTATAVSGFRDRLARALDEASA